MKKVEYVFDQIEMSEILRRLKDAEQDTRILLSQLEVSDIKDEIEGILNNIKNSIDRLEF